MHLLRIESRSIDGLAEAVDLGHSPADIVVLSFTDTDLSMLAAAWRAQPDLPSFRLANLTLLRHPYSVDLYVRTVLSKARFVLVRLLGGKDYWSYGVDELAALARSNSFQLAIVPGDHREDARLDEASTIDRVSLRRISAYFAAGGAENIGSCLRYIAGDLLAPPRHGPAGPGHLSPHDASPVGLDDWAANVLNIDDERFRPVASTAPLGHYESATISGPSSAPLALIIFYRAWMLAADTEPMVSLAQALATRGFRVAAIYVTSLKDTAVAGPLRVYLEAERPDIILNATAFSARSENSGSVLDHAGAPVVQLALSGGDRARWAASQRGLAPADLAMNVVLPEFDGRIIAGAISFKGETTHNPALEFTSLTHQSERSAIVHVADLARAWAHLRETPRGERRLACVLSDYPAKAGRTGYAVGLDTPRSVVSITERLAKEGFAVDLSCDEATMIAALSVGERQHVLSVADYGRLLTTLPAGFVARLHDVWGEPAADADVRDEAFRFRFVRAGNLLIAVQPDRGGSATRQTEYHDPNLPPRHGYVAFYLWLRVLERVHAIIHCGTHGTLEWLPGKAVALSEDCAPRAVLGPMPLIYPFIVNNPGEAAQAKRRTAAVTIGHLTPRLTDAGTHGATAELEGLFDEYAEAQSLDPRRASRLADLILGRAEEAGLTEESGIQPGADSSDALTKLDAWLCDLKDMRIGDGLHVFGGVRQPVGTEAVDPLIVDCGEAEMRGLLAALDGKFVQPGPAGAPDRGRLDVLPTGRNIYSIDPRAVPTRTAWEIGRRTAEAMLTRHAQDHGEWPRRIVLDIWGSATMRTGGDDLAQAFALLGVRPTWDGGSGRVSGFEIMPLAVLNRPRIDVTLRMSGLFRDVFPTQIALFAEIVREVAALDEAPEDNPLAASVRSAGDGTEGVRPEGVRPEGVRPEGVRPEGVRPEGVRPEGVRTDSDDTGQRIFGAAPGAYGIGLSRVLSGGDWSSRDALGETYLQATSHAYGGSSEGIQAASEFRARVAQADAYVHVQDLPGQDILDSDAFAEHGGGFAAAAASLGNHPALYHVDTTAADRSKVRTSREDVARVLRARAANPRWIAGQMRHGFRGAAEIAETVDNFFAYAALTDVTTAAQFDLLFDATIGDDTVRSFLIAANPAAANAVAERFDEAIRRGLWTSRRNSVGPITAGIRTAAP